MRLRPVDSSGYIVLIVVVGLFWFQLLCHGQNITEIDNNDNDTHSEIDYATLSLFGVSREFADQFRLNLIKAIETAKDEIDPLRQGEFGGVSGGFYQGGGAGGDQGDEEDDEDGPTTQGPGAFGVLSGIFGIFSGFLGLNPSRVFQSTVNFFPPAHRMQAQTVIDSLIGFVPSENTTRRSRPPTQRPPTSAPMVISEVMMKQVTETPGAATAMNASDANLVSKGSGNNMTGDTDSVLSEVVEAEPELTTIPGFINLHELLEKSTTPPPAQNEDDENDFEESEREVVTTDRPKSNSSMSVYKLKVRETESEVEVETRGVVEEVEATNLNETAAATSQMFATTSPSSLSNVTTPSPLSNSTSFSKLPTNTSSTSTHASI